MAPICVWSSERLYLLTQEENKNTRRFRFWVWNYQGSTTYNGDDSAGECADIDECTNITKRCYYPGNYTWSTFVRVRSLYNSRHVSSAFPHGSCELPRNCWQATTCTTNCDAIIVFHKQTDWNVRRSHESVVMKAPMKTRIRRNSLLLHCSTGT